ncbi:MAG: Mur ligase domain-containing protein, partial [Succinivibrio sp.]
MIEFTLGELARRCGGRLCGSDAAVRAVSTDSRSCKGALFVALKGEKFDGHDFIGKAVAGGACAVLASRPEEGLGVPQVICGDTLQV